MTKTQNETTPMTISTRLRWLSGIIAVVLVILAFIIIFYPPAYSTKEIDENGKTVKATTLQLDISIPFVTIFVGGISLLVFSINGLRISKLSVGNFSAEALPLIDSAKQYYEIPERERQQSKVPVEIPISPEFLEIPVRTAPEQVALPSGIIPTNEGQVAVYKLEELPSDVIEDALANWPDGGSKPDRRLLEFAARKIEKGNFSWTLKFKGEKAMVVSYQEQENYSGYKIKINPVPERQFDFDDFGWGFQVYKENTPCFQMVIKTASSSRTESNKKRVFDWAMKQIHELIDVQNFDKGTYCYQWVNVSATSAPKKVDCEGFLWNG